MKSYIKKIFKLFFVPILRTIFSIGFDKKYLKGRYFDSSLVGWSWVLRSILVQKILGYNRAVRWPIGPSNSIDDPSNIYFNPNDLQNFMHHGCYFSNVGGGKIFIEEGVVIAPNVGIITTNHSLTNIHEHLEPKDVVIGKNSWIGMNAVILPGVILGEQTVVAAGSIVSKSCPEGWSVLAGVPAKVIKRIEKDNLK